MEKPQESSISSRQISKSLKKLHINNGDIVLAKFKSSIAKEDVIEGLSVALGRMGLEDVLIVVIDDFNDLDVLNETEMNKHGWYRLKTISKITKPQ